MACPVTAAIAALDPAGQEVMGMVVDSDDYPVRDVARAFADYGHPVGPAAVVLYRDRQAQTRKNTWGNARGKGDIGA